MKRLAAIFRSWLSRNREVVVNRELHQVDLPGGEQVQITHTADCMGAACPRPQLITMRMLESMQEGDVLELVSDNPTTVETIPALTMVTSSRHLATVHTESGWRIYIRKEEC
jgi:TusA-related sulfurtransferase